MATIPSDLSSLDSPSSVASLLYTPAFPSVGPLLIQADHLGVTSLTLAPSCSAFPCASPSSSTLCTSAINQAKKHLEDAVAWLDEYFAGRVPKAFPAFHLSGTPFQLRVWEALQAIPYGTVTTYGAIASLFDSQPSASGLSASGLSAPGLSASGLSASGLSAPGLSASGLANQARTGQQAHLCGHMSAQAVGQAVGRNPVAIIIPCHRVVGASAIPSSVSLTAHCIGSSALAGVSDRALTGYAYGLPMKRALLALEGLL